MRIFPENKTLPSSVLHQQLQYVVGESLHFSLWPFFKSYPEILLHSESKKDCFCQNLPHKKFMAITATHWPSPWSQPCGADAWKGAKHTLP